MVIISGVMEMNELDQDAAADSRSVPWQDALCYAHLESAAH
ncbi:MAG: hypothetical protein R3F19_14975 [Verrucomicrobiales bacterium]